MNCGNPAALLKASLFINDEMQRDPHIPGDNITFYCAPGLVLTGPNISICMWNGEWEPDPREVTCEGN